MATSTMNYMGGSVYRITFCDMALTWNVCRDPCEVAEVANKVLEQYPALSPKPQTPNPKP